MRKYKSSLDQFYTDPETAKRLLSTVKLPELVIEPSAGNGAFSQWIPCLAMDIDPKTDNIIKQDFFSYHYSGDLSRDQIICIGNPPFGKQNNLALRFICHAASFCGMIAFILPKSFLKVSVQERLPDNLHLIHSEPLDNAFILDGKPHHVPCVWQIWQWKEEKRIKKAKIEPIDFRFCRPEEANISVRRVGYYAGKASNDICVSEQSHYFIYSEKDIISLLNSHIWEHNNTVGPRSISKPELISVINSMII